jgi:hypothetical protein
MGMSEMHDGHEIDPQAIIQDLVMEAERFVENPRIAASSYVLPSALPQARRHLETTEDTADVEVNQALALDSAHWANQDLRRVVASAHSQRPDEYQSAWVGIACAYTSGYWRQTTYTDHNEGFDTSISKVNFKHGLAYLDASYYMISTRVEEADQESISILVIDGRIAHIQQYYSDTLQPYLTDIDYASLLELLSYLRSLESY